MLSLFLVTAALAAKPVPPPRETVLVVVEDVTPAGDEHLLFLTDVPKTRVVPIQIGESEAIATAFRLAGRQPEQPRPYELIEALGSHVGANLEYVHIHALDDGFFEARLTYTVKRKRIDLEARASDAVVLALGRKVPIYMSTDVYERTAVAIADLIEAMEGAGRKLPTRL